MKWPRYPNGTPVGLVGVIIGTFVVTLTLPTHYCHKNAITKRLQNNYVNLYKLKTSWKDLQRDGKLETILQYDGKSYLFKLDTNGKPYCEVYKVEPAKIVEIPNKER